MYKDIYSELKNRDKQNLLKWILMLTQKDVSDLSASYKYATKICTGYTNLPKITKIKDDVDNLTNHLINGEKLTELYLLEIPTYKGSLEIKQLDTPIHSIYTNNITNNWLIFLMFFGEKSPYTAIQLTEGIIKGEYEINDEMTEFIKETTNIHE